MATVLTLLGIEIAGADLWILVDVVTVTALAFGIHRFSRTCALLMFVYFLVVCIYLLGKTGVINIIIRSVFLYYFGMGAKATFIYHKLTKGGN